MQKERIYDLDARLIEFAASIIKVTEALPETAAGKYVAGQLVRSGVAPTLQYGEAQAAESPKDFIHKMKVALKELRETFNALRVIRRVSWFMTDDLTETIKENNELIAIFVASIGTARKNIQKQKKGEAPGSGSQENS
jgi:four helix bundle protein